MNESNKKNIILGSSLAGVSAVLALMFRAYRFHFQKDMRIHPKVSCSKSRSQVTLNSKLLAGIDTLWYIVV